MEQWDKYVSTTAELITTRETYQRQLGQIAATVQQLYGGLVALQKLSEDVKENSGLSLSPSTLRNYGWVYLQTMDLELPDDLSYRTLQYIAGSGDPKKWAERIEKEGLSSKEVYRLIREEKGMTIKQLECPSCHFKWDAQKTPKA